MAPVIQCISCTLRAEIRGRRWFDAVFREGREVCSLAVGTVQVARKYHPSYQWYSSAAILLFRPTTSYYYRSATLLFFSPTDTHTHTHIIIIIIGTTAPFEPRPSSEASASCLYSLQHSSNFSPPNFLASSIMILTYIEIRHSTNQISGP